MTDAPAARHRRARAARLAVPAMLVALAIAAAACSGSPEGASGGSTTTAGEATSSSAPAAIPTSSEARLADETAARLAAAALDSISASPNAELTVTFPDAVLGTASALVKRLGLHLEITTGSQAPISSLKAGNASQAAMELDVSTGATPLVETRVVAGHAYLRFEVKNLAALGGPLTPADQSELATLDPLFGERWLELPARPASSSGAPSGALPSGTAAELHQLAGDLSANTTYSRTAGPDGGSVIEVSGDLGASLRAALLGILPTLAPLTSLGGSSAGQLRQALASVQASFAARLSCDASGSLTAATLHLVVQAASLDVDVAVSHAPVTVSAPSGATPLSSSMLSGLLGSAGVGSGASGASGGGSST